MLTSALFVHHHMALYNSKSGPVATQTLIAVPYKESQFTYRFINVLAAGGPVLLSFRLPEPRLAYKLYGFDCT